MTDAFTAFSVPSTYPAEAMCVPEVRQRVVLRHLYIKTIILPRQARDTHRENSKRERRFLIEWDANCNRVDGALLRADDCH